MEANTEFVVEIDETTGPVRTEPGGWDGIVFDLEDDEVPGE